MKLKIIHNNEANRHPSRQVRHHLQILQRSENASSITQKKRTECLCTKQGCDKLGPKQHYTANTKHHVNINDIRKAISCT